MTTGSYAAGRTGSDRRNGPAAAVGFLPTENDQDLVGGMLVDPNALTPCAPALQDRSHIGKIAAAYRFPTSPRRAIVRYGRPAVHPSRVAPARAHPGGDRDPPCQRRVGVHLRRHHRRPQKTFTAGRARCRQVDAHLPNLGNEVIEHVVSGPAFRTPTALQPPRTALAGLRVTF
jgi:hypothetical protein